MKPISSLFLLLSLSLNLLAQSLSGNITYTFTTVFDGFPMPREAQLIFDQDKSVFMHSQGNGPRIFDRNGQEISMEDAMKVDPTNKGQLFSAYLQDPLGDIYYTDFSSKRMVFREIVVQKAFLVEEPQWIEFRWQLGKEKKQIGKFTCQKASTNFRGRSYTAWFTTEIPVPYGPWKFHGLPGLILEVSDESEEVKFMAKKVNIPYEEEKPIAPPTDGEKVSLEEFMQAEYNIKKALVEAQKASADRKAGQKQEFEIGKINRVEKVLK